MMRLSEQILFLLAYGERYFPELGELLNKPYQYGSLLPKNDRAVRRALTRLRGRGEVTVQGRRGRARYRVTREGMARLIELRPYLPKPFGSFDRTPSMAAGRQDKFAQGKPEWDGKWRVVVFDIPERYRGMRAVLRRFLASLGAVAFQRSLWVTPFSVTREIRAFLEASRLSEMAFLLEIENIYGLGPEGLANRVWRLEEMGQKYEAFALECGGAKRVEVSHRRMLSRLIFNDPLLPRELLPENFSRVKALRVYRELVERSSLNRT